MFRLCVATVFLLGSILVAQEKPQPPAPHPYPPQSKEPPGPPASELDNKHREAKVPSVNVPEQDARAAVNSFITWASASDVRQREEVRRMIAASRENKPVSAALCEEAFQAREKDHSRAVVVLSLLGEMRSETGGECLGRFLHLPFPEKGTVIDGEIVEQTALGTLQAKAVDGLAYLHSRSGDEAVLWAVSKHPSRIVRAEAIEAYLWNHNYSAEARSVLESRVRENERIFLDRVHRDPAEPAESFNQKLAEYLKEHPEAVAPQPTHAKQKRRPQDDSDQPPSR